MPAKKRGEGPVSSRCVHKIRGMLSRSFRYHSLARHAPSQEWHDYVDAHSKADHFDRTEAACGAVDVDDLWAHHRGQGFVSTLTVVFAGAPRVDPCADSVGCVI
jgi:hypothetical protein